MSMHHYVACDLGAESGRVMLGTLDNGRLTLEEIHRFANGPVAVNGSLRWDVLRIFDELKAGLRKVAARGIKIESISTDSWGVDYVLLRNSEPLLTPPYHYRDARTDGALERAFAVVPADEIFAQTGIQFMPINTLYQLLTDQSTRPWALTAATQFLNIADCFNWLLCGVAKAEESLASTTQLYDPRHHRWSGRSSLVHGKERQPDRPRGARRKNRVRQIAPLRQRTGGNHRGARRQSLVHRAFGQSHRAAQHHRHSDRDRAAQGDRSRRNSRRQRRQPVARRGSGQSHRARHRLGLGEGVPNPGSRQQPCDDDARRRRQRVVHRTAGQQNWQNHARRLRLGVRIALSRCAARNRGGRRQKYLGHGDSCASDLSRDAAGRVHAVPHA